MFINEKTQQKEPENEAGQNIEIFTNKVHNIAMKIQGCGNPPDDLPSLVVKNFLVCDIEAFCLTAIHLHNKADRNWNTSNWGAILLELKAKYRTCVSQNL